MRTILFEIPGNQGEGRTPGGSSDLIPKPECSREPWLTLWDEAQMKLVRFKDADRASA